MKYTDEDIEFTKQLVSRVGNETKIVLEGEIQELLHEKNGLDNAIEFLSNGYSGDNSSMVSLLSQLRDK